MNIKVAGEVYEKMSHWYNLKKSFQSSAHGSGPEVKTEASSVCKALSCHITQYIIHIVYIH